MFQWKKKFWSVTAKRVSSKDFLADTNCVYIKETLEIKNLNFQKRWTRDYFEYKELNEDISSEEENEDSDENQEIENEMDQSAEEEIQSDSLNKVKIIWFF